MERVLITGHAQLGSEAFDFEIGPWSGGVGLMMRHTGYGDPKLTGGGIWPSVEKAKQVADQTVKRLLGPTSAIVWTETSSEI
jgi:hypothetical protein